MIRVIAKPDLEAAQQQAAAAGVNGLVFNRVSQLGDWLILDAPDTPGNRRAVMRWFTSCPDDTPFPPGSCLWYRWSDQRGNRLLTAITSKD